MKFTQEELDRVKEMLEAERVYLRGDISEFKTGRYSQYAFQEVLDYLPAEAEWLAINRESE